MNRPLVPLINYVSPPADAYWGWSSDGRQIELSSGEVLVGLDHVVSVLRRLQASGLPPFGAVVLLLAACHEGWKKPGTVGLHVASYVKYLEERRTLSARTSTTTLEPLTRLISDRITRVMAGLDGVRALPREYRTNPGHKAVLAEVVFEGARALVEPSHAAGLVDALEISSTLGTLSGQEQAGDPYTSFLRDIESLSEGLGQLSEERLAWRARTGLDGAPGTLGVRHSVPDRVRKLLDELADDRELSGMARAALRLMSVAHISRPLGTPDELPLGGVTDLSQRGPLDRLLVSELAHDDLTLAVRVALNEALYLRREIPPKDPPRSRIIILDSGIRLWGRPRVLACAAALAFAATSDGRARTVMVRAEDRRLVPIDPASRAGLMRHLGALSPHPHPGRALAALESVDGMSEEGVQTLLITHPRVLGDVDFLKYLRALPRPIGLIATLDAEGRFTLRSHGPRSFSTLRECVVSVDGLGPAADPGTMTVSSDVGAHALPLLLRLEPFPLFMPVHVPPHLMACNEDAGIAVAMSGDGRMLRWGRVQKGAQQLSARMPRGKVHLVEAGADGDVQAVVGRPEGRLVVVQASPWTSVARSTTLEGSWEQITEVVSRPEGILVVAPRSISLHDPATGKAIAHLGLVPVGMMAAGGRFFQIDGAHHVVHYDGRELKLIHVPGVEKWTARIFDRSGLEGPWGLSRDGKIFSTASRESFVPKWPISPPFSVDGISRDGHRLAVRSRLDSGDTRQILDLETRTLTPCSTDIVHSLEPRLREWQSRAGKRSVRHRFAATAVDGQGRLMLVSSDGRVIHLTMASGGMPRFDSGGHVGTGVTTIALERVENSVCPGISISRAQWSRGGQVFVDSRGIVHIKAIDPKLPEVAAVISEGPTAFWSSHGTLVGDPFFVGETRGQSDSGQEAVAALKAALGGLA